MLWNFLYLHLFGAPRDRERLRALPREGEPSAVAVRVGCGGVATGGGGGGTEPRWNE